jgi:hypothetical protein
MEGFIRGPCVGGGISPCFSVSPPTESHWRCWEAGAPGFANEGIGSIGAELERPLRHRPPAATAGRGSVAD